MTRSAQKPKNYRVSYKNSASKQRLCMKNKITSNSTFPRPKVYEWGYLGFAGKIIIAGKGK